MGSWWVTDPAAGAILGTNAVVSTVVQEIIDGEPGSVNRDEERLDDHSNAFPLDATADLTSTDLGGKIVSLGQGLARFSDPTRLDQANPEEFALEVACYSNVDSLGYVVEGSAIESRTVIFTTPGSRVAPAEIVFRSDGTRVIESRAFVSGAVILWSTNAAADLEGIESEVRFLIRRGQEPEPLFSTTLQLSGADISGLNDVAVGPIQFDEVTLTELSDLGVDSDTLAILGEVAQNGTLRIVVIPAQEHAYTYEARADEDFVLSATLEARVRNAPGGTGVAAVLGRPFEQLGGFIELALPGVDGAAIERSIHLAHAKRSGASRQGIDAYAGSSARRMCGAMGLEGLLLLLLSPWALGFLPRR
jgi:hypothetical protein